MKLTFELNREDYIAFQKYCLKQDLELFIYKFAIYVLILEFILNRRQFDLQMTILTVLAALAVYTFLFYRKWKIDLNRVMSDISALGQKEFDFSDENIKYKAKYSRSEFDWILVKKLNEGSAAFYIQIHPNRAWIIPKHVFKESSEMEDFKKSISSRTHLKWN